MNAAQIRKLETIIAKLERLQLEADDRAGTLNRAKGLLLDALRKAQR